MSIAAEKLPLPRRVSSLKNPAAMDISDAKMVNRLMEAFM
jgi:hypothetical protein